MSDVEAVMWTVESDPTLRCDFCNLTIVDSPIDFERMQDRIHDIVRAIPKLGQRVVETPFRLANPQWVDADLDLAYHLQQVELAAPGGERELLDACAALADQNFDRDRPLWRFTVFSGLANGGGAMLQKVHHAITDGVGGLKLSLEIVDFEANPPSKRALRTDTTPVPPGPSLVDSARNAIVDATTRTVNLATSAISNTSKVVTDPLGAPGRVNDAFSFAGSLRRQLLITEGARSDLIDDRSNERRFETRNVSISAMKEQARKYGGTLNDLFVAMVADALGQYHRMLGSEVRELRMAMPVNTRGKHDIGGNHFTPTRVVVPIESDSPMALFKEIQTRLEQTKLERALNSAALLASLATNLPAAMITAAARNQTSTIDFATSNLRGSPAPLFLVGSRITANYPLGPRTGCAINFSLLSYCDEANIGINIDPAAITDPALLLKCLDTTFETWCANPSVPS